VYKIKAFLIPVIILSVACASIAFNTIYVDVNGPNDPGSGTYADPFRRIQDAIDIAADGDTIEIQPGLYTGNGNYNLDPNGKSITIRSVDPNTPENTIIDSNYAGRGFYIHNGEDANCIISGLTIRNASTAAGSNGAGISCYNCSPTIYNCVIKDGRARISGGGICFDYSNATVINCTIMGNTADCFGGGIGCYSSSPLIIGCNISGNAAWEEGGGIDSGLSDLNIFNSVIINNNAPLGGGINCYYPGIVNLINCAIAANSSTDTGGAVYCWFGGNAAIKNSILWANSANNAGMQIGLMDNGQASITYCDVQGGQTGIYDPCEHLVWGQGNIDANPYFTSFDPNGDPNIWDFHLQSAYGRWDQNSQTWVTDSNTSLCIDAGDPNSDWSSEPWPNGKRINIGAYGGTTQASKNGNPADFNIDNLVNFADFAQIAKQWLAEQTCIEDLNNDGEVNFADIHIFVENWLWEKN
jgi:hypothetical protein